MASMATKDAAEAGDVRDDSAIHSKQAPLRMRKHIHELRIFLMMCSNLVNWREVWACYRSGQTLPEFRFKRGFCLQHHAQTVETISLLQEIFRDRLYREGKEPQLGIILDVGANIGCATLDWLSRLPSVMVHAYEPNAQSFALLSRNIEANGFWQRAKIYNEAVGRDVGTIRLHATGPTTLCSAYVGGSEREFITVRAVSLDEVVRRCGDDVPIAVLKLDVEGAEADILEGADCKCLGKIGKILIEAHDFLVPGAAARCQRVLDSGGFRYTVRQLGHPGVSMIYAFRS